MLSLDAVMPHRKPMRLVTGLAFSGPDATEAVARIDEDCLFLRADGTLEPEAFAEIMAQAFAAGMGAHDPLGQQARWGYLAGIRQLEILGCARAGDTLRATARASSVIGDITVVEGELFREQERLARIQLKIYIPRSEIFA